MFRLVEKIQVLPLQFEEGGGFLAVEALIESFDAGEGFFDQAPVFFGDKSGHMRFFSARLSHEPDRRGYDSAQKRP